MEKKRYRLYDLVRSDSRPIHNVNRQDKVQKDDLSADRNRDEI